MQTYKNISLFVGYSDQKYSVYIIIHSILQPPICILQVLSKANKKKQQLIANTGQEKISKFTEDNALTNTHNEKSLTIRF